MNLNRFTDLALRVLMYLALLEDRGSATIGEMSAKLEVPFNHLVKVVGRLDKLGWVKATRGRSGGVRMGLDPAALRIGMVVRELESARPIVDCTSPLCVLHRRCGLKYALDRALDAFYAALDEVTLADMIVGETRAAVISIQSLHRLRPATSVGVA